MRIRLVWRAAALAAIAGAVILLLRPEAAEKSGAPVAAQVDAPEPASVPPEALPSAAAAQREPAQSLAAAPAPTAPTNDAGPSLLERVDRERPNWADSFASVVKSEGLKKTSLMSAVIWPEDRPTDEQIDQVQNEMEPTWSELQALEKELRETRGRTCDRWIAAGLAQRCPDRADGSFDSRDYPRRADQCAMFKEVDGVRYYVAIGRGDDPETDVVSLKIHERVVRAIDEARQRTAVLRAGTAK